VGVTYAIPVLPARELDATVAFWRDELGFRHVFSGEDYAIVERDDVQVHFWGPATDLDPLENDGGCRLGVDDVDAAYEEYRRHVFCDLEQKPWGLREFAVLDPNRNLIWLVESK
jgi:catechol 2,3-dioxygenase-like lactoylglutathione lyase family enzyme